jgi:exosortase/archaeosortase family protein
MSAVKTWFPAAFFRRNSDTARLFLALLLALGGIAVIDASNTLQAAIEPYARLIAALTSELIRWGGMSVTRTGSVLTHPDGFGYRIGYLCTGIRPALVLLLAIAALPTSLRHRCAAIALGLAGVAVLNLCRLLHLYWTGVEHTEQFALMHQVVWNIIAVVAVLAYFAACLWRARRSCA